MLVTSFLSVLVSFLVFLIDLLPSMLAPDFSAGLLSLASWVTPYLQFFNYFLPLNEWAQATVYVVEFLAGWLIFRGMRYVWFMTLGR